MPTEPHAGVPSPAGWCVICGGLLVTCAVCKRHIPQAAIGQQIHPECDPRTPEARAAELRDLIRGLSPCPP